MTEYGVGPGWEVRPVRILNDHQARLWCEDRSLAVASDKTPHFNTASYSLEVKLPEKGLQMVMLAHSLIAFEQGMNSQGALFWITQRGIWGEESEKIGEAVFRLMRLAFGQEGSIQSGAAHLFEEAERMDLRAFLVQPMVFGWDAYLIPGTAEFFVFTSHDEVIYFVTSKRHVLDRALEHFQPWSPVERGPRYLKGLWW